MNTFRSAFAVVAIGAAVSLAGCASPEEPAVVRGVDGSRHEIYDSVDGLVQDSSAVVTVEVLSQERGELDAPEGVLATPLTISTVRVLELAEPDELAETLPGGESTVAVGDELVVRQLGDAEMESTPAPIMEIGGSYLLFLTPTGLPGEAADEFYVTGAVAGLFEPSSSGRGGETGYTSLSHDGDDLPSDITLGDIGS
jgi:hypothetical protein